MKKKRVILMGSTGSIGESALDVVRNLAGQLEIVGLAAGSSFQTLLEQVEEFHPEAVALSNPDAAQQFTDQKTASSPTVYAGPEGLVKLVEETSADVVLAAISGAAGLPATLAAVETGKDLALANKESLVMAGSLLTQRARELGRSILPVDSEHSAIFQSLQAGRPQEVRRIILTASGGPFRKHSREDMARVTPEAALRHPTWDMGAKITIDSATLMNKALELIEARWLFDLPAEQIDVVVHPQSIIHSLVEFIDGSTICQLGPPDMRIPIQYALTYPERHSLPGMSLNLAELRRLDFEEPDPERFPSLRFAYESLTRGGSSATVLNAANEIAVELFLKGKIDFLRIFDMVESALSAHNVIDHPSLEDIFEVDRWAREEVLAKA